MNRKKLSALLNFSKDVLKHCDLKKLLETSPKKSNLSERDGNKQKKGKIEKFNGSDVTFSNIKI